MREIMYPSCQNMYSLKGAGSKDKRKLPFIKTNLYDIIKSKSVQYCKRIICIIVAIPLFWRKNYALILNIMVNKSRNFYVLAIIKKKIDKAEKNGEKPKFNLERRLGKVLTDCMWNKGGDKKRQSRQRKDSSPEPAPEREAEAEIVDNELDHVLDGL